MGFKTITFYKYFDIKKPFILKESLLKKCKELNILGRILIAEEGINAGISGETQSIEIFKEYLYKFTYFKDLTFREQEVKHQSYHRLVVRTRKEIVVFGKKVNLQKTGKFIDPQTLKTSLDNKEDLILIDARNDYESSIGKFKDAETLPISTFREFHKASKTLAKYKDKKIVLYCTGGIRCEKASAYLVEQGFTDVNQLQGGIINYIGQYPQTYFEGACFVFDDRIVSPSGKPISQCKHCSQETDQCINCHNLDCDSLFISCFDCQEKMNKTCSISCKEAPRQRKEIKKKVILGTVKNYYTKSKAALIFVEKELSKHQTISIIGKTTNLSQEIKELRADDGTPIEQGKRGELITIPVSARVRKNDKILLQ